MNIVGDIIIGLGLFFIVVSTIALLIMPDLYTRAHAVAKSETLGLMLVFLGLFFRPEIDASSFGRLAFVLVFSLIANPTAVHALVRAASRSGALPWTVVDQDIADDELGLSPDTQAADDGGARADLYPRGVAENGDGEDAR
jgi:multicomponent Na+:H+ antiporter subunit G